MNNMTGQKYFTGYRHSDVWDDLGLIGDTLQFTDDEVTTKVGIGYTRTQVSLRTAMEAALQFTLLSAGPGAELSREDMLNDHTRLAYYIEEGIVFTGWCTDEEDADMVDWVYRSDMEPRHKNRIASSYDYKSIQVSRLGRWYGKAGDESYPYWQDGAYEGADILQYKKNMRTLIHGAPDKKVLSCISRVLSRLIQGKRVIKIGAGRERRFKWDNWGWVDEIRQQKTVSNSKARKLGDVVNGWEYIIARTREVYGVPIHKYKWKPVNRETLKYYGCLKVGATNHNWDYHTYAGWKGHFIFFYDEEEARQAIAKHNDAAYELKLKFDALVAEMSSVPSVFGSSHRIELNANGTSTEPVQHEGTGLRVALHHAPITLHEASFNLSLPAHANVEDIASPEEIVERMQLQRTDMLKQYMDSVELKGHIPVERVFMEGEQ
jgi:hypothetical protein